MTVKCSASSNPRTFLAIAAEVARTLPNSPWVLGIHVVLDGNLANTTNQHLFCTGSQNATGSLRMVINTGIAQPELNVYLNNSTSGSATLKFTPVASKGYLMLVMRQADGKMVTKLCPVLTSDPVDGSAVLTSTISVPTLTTSLAGQGIGVNSVPCLIIGERAGDQRLDQSIARPFRYDGTLTDLEIAKLAFGLELGDLGKTSFFYFRLNDGSDTADLGPNKFPVTLSQNPLPTGTTAPGFGYVSVNSPPTVTAPSIPTPVQAGTTVIATSGTVAGYPYPAITWQWYFNGVAISGATAQSYIPTPAQVTASNLLQVEEIVDSAQGHSSARSAGVPVVAAANAIYITPPDNERIFQRSGTSAVVPLSGTYTGAQPAMIEMQTYLSDGVTVARQWVDIGANIAAGGTWSANVTIPQTAEKVRPQIRAKDASGNIIGQASAIHANRFGVGDLIAFIGSSSAEAWDGAVNGTTPVTNTVSRYKDSWGVYGTKNYADTMAAAIAAKSGVVVGILPYGVGGTSMNDWNVTDRLGVWSSFSAGVAAVGGKLAAVFISLGSNDAAGGWGNVVSRDSHAGKMRLTISRVRSLTGQASLVIVWSGYNRRTSQTTGMTQAQFDIQSNYVRMAENDVGNDANVYHVPALQFELSGDGIHLTTGATSGFMSCVLGLAYVYNAAIFDGVYKRGPKITSLVASGSGITVAWQLRGGDTDVATPLSLAGIAVTDGTGTPGLLSFTRMNAGQGTITCDRQLVEPVSFAFLGGSAPPVSGNIYGNGAMALPMHVETDMAVTYQATAPVADTTAPAMSGSASVGNVTLSGATVTFPAATDNVAVAGYEYSLNNGSTWTPTNSTATSLTLSSLAASTNYSGLVRAIDTSSNRSNTVPFSFTTTAAPDTTAPTLGNATASQTGQTTAAGSVTTTEAGGTLYRLASRNATESAAAVKAGQSSTVTAAGAQAVSFDGLAAGTTYYGHFLHRDAAGNESAVANTAAFTTGAESPATVTNFTPSSSRTLKVLPGHGFSAEGAFWDLSNPDKPVGTMDSGAVLDIVLDWTGYLVDIGSPAIGNATITVAGVQNTSPLGRGNLTILFASAVAGAAGAVITFKIWTATTPQVIDERTVYLKFEDK